MLLERVEAAVRPGQEAAFEAALCEVRQRVFMSPGFRGFTAFEGVDRPSTYMVHVLWETPEELIEFTESGRFERCWAPIETFLAERLRVDHFTERPMLDLRGPGVISELDWLGPTAPKYGSYGAV